MSNVTILGIDPGLSGGLAWMTENGAIEHLEIMPRVKASNTLDLPALVELLQTRRPQFVGIEKAECRPLHSVQATMTTGTNFGCILGILAALEIPTFQARPAEWHRAICGTQPADLDPKEKALREARKRFKGVSFVPKTGRSKMSHEGLIDAALIAEHVRLASRVATSA